jgi:hypothetical protein
MAGENGPEGRRVKQHLLYLSPRKKHINPFAAVFISKTTKFVENWLLFPN